MADTFDLEAVRQWADYPLPVERDKWPALVNQIRSDVSACCDYIEELEAKLAGNAAARHVSAEAEVARLREALGQISEPNPEAEGDWGATYDWQRSAIVRRDIARAALADKEGT